MYADKPRQGQGLIKAIARVNRVFKDKSGGWGIPINDDFKPTTTGR